VSGSFVKCWRVAAFMAACSLLPGSAWAQSTAGTAATAAMAGAMAGSAAATAQPLEQPRELVGSQLPEWIDIRTGFASRLAASCGVIVEATLSSTPARNYLNLTLQSDETSKVSFRSSDVTAHFGSGLVRHLTAERAAARGLETADGRWLHVPFSFPSKAEFEHEERLRIELLLELRDQGPCIASLEFERRTDVAVPKKSYTSYPPFAINFGISTHFAATGDLRTIAERVNAGFELSMIGFGWVHHGIGLELGFDGYGSHGLSAVIPGRDANGLAGVYFMPMYAYRILLSERFTPQLEFGAGLYHLYVQTEDKAASFPSSNSLGLREKLKLNILLGSFGDGTRFELAPALVHTYIPAGDFGDATVSGNLFSGALYLVLD